MIGTLKIWEVQKKGENDFYQDKLTIYFACVCITYYACLYQHLNWNYTTFVWY